MMLVPGAALMAALKTRPANSAGRVVLAVCLSMMSIMIVGGVVSLIGPHVGLARPLDSLPESVIWFVIAIVLLAVNAVKHRDPVTWILEGVRAEHLLGLLAGGLLVVVSILGVAQLNHSGNIHLAVVSTSLDVIVILVGVVGGWKRSSRWPLSTLLYFVSLALLLSTSLRGSHLYGWDIQKEFGVASHTLYDGVWSVPANRDPFASMLSLTVLPTILRSLVRLRLLAFFQLVVPAILALAPVAMLTALRRVPRWINNGRRRPPRPGLTFGIVAGIIVSSVAFSSLLVSITRQAMAVTMLATLVMVVFDRTMSVRSTRIVVGLLIVAISFTHYTTSYLLAGIVLITWVVGWFWARGWLSARRARIQEHRSNVHKRQIINAALVIVALAAAFGWNLGVTRNNALANTASAFAAVGAGLTTSSDGESLPAPKLEKILVRELQKTDSWIVPAPGANSIRLKTVNVASSPGVAPALNNWWNRVNLWFEEGIWGLLGFSLLYGVFRLGRRQSDLYSADVVGLGAAGLIIGGLSRYSGTLAALFTPERAAIYTAILLAVPVTMMLDDFVDYLASLGTRVARATPVVGVTIVGILVFSATGLGSLFFVGYPPGSLTANGVNAQQFTVSTEEFATASWLRAHAGPDNPVQTDLFGQLVLLSKPGDYNLVDEIVPKEVDINSYVYLTTANLVDKVTQVEADNFNYFSSYRTNISFFNRNFYIVYSTGDTRVYH